MKLNYHTKVRLKCVLTSLHKGHQLPGMVDSTQAPVASCLEVTQEGKFARSAQGRVFSHPYSEPGISGNHCKTWPVILKCSSIIYIISWTSSDHCVKLYDKNTKETFNLMIPLGHVSLSLTHLVPHELPGQLPVQWGIKGQRGYNGNISFCPGDDMKLVGYIEVCLAWPKTEDPLPRKC